MSTDKLKNKLPHLALFSFLVINMFLANLPPLIKGGTTTLLFAATLIICFIKRDNSKEILHYFIYLNNDKMIKKASGIASLISWVFFFLFLFFANLSLTWISRLLLLGFVLLTISSGILLFYDLRRSEPETYNKIKFILGGFISLLYVITSAYAASYFLQSSNMDISDSPLLELGWKLAFFAIIFFMLSQPIAFTYFLYSSNKLVGHPLMNSLATLLTATFLMIVASKWAGNFSVLVFDWATKSEWHTSATCGTLKISNEKEKYFGFNTDKYTIYFSNRDGKWGFEEMKCTKDEKNQDSSIRVPISTSNMPKWFNE